MDIYKHATKIGLRIDTSFGPLGVEQLWKLSRNKLSIILKNLKKKLNSDTDDDLAFLDENATQVDKITQLAFDIVKDIYITKRDEADAVKSQQVKKEQLQELLREKQRREKESVKDITDDDLEKRIVELS